MEIPLLNDIIIIFGLSIVVLYICHRLRIPTVVGFLITGIFAGPYGLGLIEGVHEVELIAEIGIILLLFTIGIEFSLDKLLSIRKSVLMGGSLQVLITFGAVFLFAVQMGQDTSTAIFFGFLAALSSTAIVLKLLQERAEIDSPYGNTALGILIFQDIIIVPMILITPLLAGSMDISGESIALNLAKGTGIILFILILAKWIIPGLLYQITKTRNHELFLMSVVVLCFGIAWLTSKSGLSLALGAFIAGLIISESEYSHQALGNILPFRDIFTTFFFVSIGMMLDLRIVIQHPGLIILITLIVLILKALIAGSVTLSLGFSLRTGVLTGLSLSQIGEFSFILSLTGVQYKLLTGNSYQMFLAVAILTMAATPFAIAFAPRLADFVLRLPLPERVKSGSAPASVTKPIIPGDHLIIVGFGVNGRNVARAARKSDIPYVIIETNPDTVKSEQAKGEPIYYGDATHETVLRHAHIGEARIVVVAINDPAAMRRIIEEVKTLNPGVHLIVRTRYIQDMQDLYRAGADEVIPEEFETSVEIFTRVLTSYLIPRDEIDKLITSVRADNYEIFRSPLGVSTNLSDLKRRLHDIDIATFQIQDKSLLVGKTLGQAMLRQQYGISVVAVRHDGRIMSNPGAETVLHHSDVLYVLGSPEKITGSAFLFTSSMDSKDISNE
ncbi:MAG TPA: cation:proton antiporter [Balneolales bacterium]|nr:cation:proton antiporter [Balneolales bacterium]